MKSIGLYLASRNCAQVSMNLTDFANTPLDEHIWEDEDFEEEKDEVETEADRAIEALETVRKKKEEDAKWMRWAEIQYPDPRKANAAVTTAGKAVVAASTEKLPLPNLKKPASSMKPEEIRAEISDMVRKQLLPAVAGKFPLGKETDKHPEKKSI